MSANAEAAYFDGVPCQHVADWERHVMLRRRRQYALDAYERRRPVRRPFV